MMASRAASILLLALLAAACMATAEGRRLKQVGRCCLHFVLVASEQQAMCGACTMPPLWTASIARG